MASCSEHLPSSAIPCAVVVTWMVFAEALTHRPRTSHNRSRRDHRVNPPATPKALIDEPPLPPYGESPMLQRRATALNSGRMSNQLILHVLANARKQSISKGPAKT